MGRSKSFESKSFENAPVADVQEEYTKTIAEELEEIREEVDRPIAGKVLEIIKTDETFSRLVNCRGDRNVGPVDSGLVGDMLHSGNKVGGAFNPEILESEVFSIASDIISGEKPKAIKRIKANTCKPFKDGLSKIQESRQSLFAESTVKKEQLEAEKTTHLESIELLRGQVAGLEQEINSVNEVGAKSSDYSDPKALLENLDVFPVGARETIKASIESISRGKSAVGRVAYAFVGGQKRDFGRIIGVVNTYRLSLNKKISLLQTEIASHQNEVEVIDQKLSQNSETIILGSEASKNIKEAFAERIETVRGSGFSGAADMAVLSRELGNLKGFVSDLLTLYRQAEFFVSTEGSLKGDFTEQKIAMKGNLGDIEAKRKQVEDLSAEMESLREEIKNSTDTSEIGGKLQTEAGLQKQINKVTRELERVGDLMGYYVKELAQSIVGTASVDGLKKLRAEFERIMQVCSIVSQEAVGLPIEVLSSLDGYVSEAIGEVAVEASDTIISCVRNEMTSAISGKPTPDNNKDTKTGAFDMSMMKSYTARGGQAVEFVLGYGGRWHCTRGEVPGGNVNYIINPRVNSNIPSALIKAAQDSGYDYTLLRQHGGDYQNTPYETDISVLWVPIKPGTITTKGDLETALSIFTSRTTSTQESAPRNSCDVENTFVKLKAEIHGVK